MVKEQDHCWGKGKETSSWWHTASSGEHEVVLILGSYAKIPDLIGLGSRHLCAAEWRLLFWRPCRLTPLSPSPLLPPKSLRLQVCVTLQSMDNGICF